MDEEHSLLQHLLQLEERLLQPDFRRDSGEVTQLLADNFREFGGSGRIYNKQQVIERLQYDTDDNIRTLSDFQAVALAPSVMLATYRVAQHSKLDGQTACSLRTSIWILRQSRWQMVFHQGTPSNLP